MRLPGFIGGSYTSQSILADSQRAVNVYPEAVESGLGKNKIVLYGRPGLKKVLTLAQAPIRGIFAQDGRVFVVAGTLFVEVNVDFSYTVRGVVAGGGGLVSMCTNGSGGHQLLVVSAGLGYIFDLVTAVFTQIASAAFPANATMAIFLDGYFVVLKTDTNQIQLSGLEKGLDWNGLDVTQRTSGSDNIQAIIADHRQLWLIGSRSTEVWYDSGGLNFPFAPIPGAFLERGAIRWTVTKLDNTVCFVGTDGSGSGVAYRAADFVPKRVSTHAVEYAWRQYSTIQDAESLTYQEQGHVFWVINFPTAQATWVYDAATNEWHEEDWWNAATGLYERARPRCHCFEWGLHLVGDRDTGDIYEQSMNYLDDAGINIRHRRRAPHLCNEQLWEFHSAFQLDAEVGMGQVVSSDGVLREPQATLRWSDDGGRTWSNDYTAGLGLIGQWKARATWNRLGRARDRVYEVEISDPVPVRLIDAYLTIQQGTS